MKLTFFGAAKEVGRSAFLIEQDNEKLLLDCGVKLGEKTEYPQLSDSVASGIQSVVVTHTHLDHIGYLPFVFANKKVAIYATKPTRDLLQVLLSDFQRLQKGEKRFSSKDINSILQKIKITEYNSTVMVPRHGAGKGLSFRLLEAGHILGSAMVLVNPSQAGKNSGKLLYTGDFNLSGSKIMNSCERDIEVENLIVESTYGGKEDVFPSQKEILKKFSESVNETIKAGGVVIIPSFAVGRGQEILLILSDLIKSKVIIECPIYVDGMIKKANRIYRQNVIYAKREIQLRILVNEEDPFKSPYFKYSEKKDKSDLQTPCIIVTTSGMLTGGPVVGYLKRFGNNPANKIIFIGYQAEGTNGRKILEGEKDVTFFGEKIKISAKSEYHRFSGHSDRLGLISFIKGIKGLKRVFLVHGEPQKIEELKQALGNKFEIIVPENGQGFEI